MTHLFWLALIKGYTTTASLIIAMGTQNAFILRQGLLKSHVLIVAILASIIDILLIILGVSGVGFIITSHHYLMLVAKYGSVVFLFLYGCKCFYSVFFKTTSIEDENVTGKRSIKSTIITLLAITFLNPHTYVDTMLLIGSIGAGLAEEQKIYYIIGAGAASTSWFFCLSYGSRLLIPFFKKPISWKILNIFIGIIMWCIAYSIYYK
ncbi:MAG: LysE/ArgO family amino acid transporter [Rickettsiaceae bacterium]